MIETSLLDRDNMYVWLGTIGASHRFAVPMVMFKPHENQALYNHAQSLNMLASRGGLHISEAVAILEDRPFESMALPDALRRLKEIAVDFAIGDDNDSRKIQ